MDAPVANRGERAAVEEAVLNERVPTRAAVRRKPRT